MFGIRRRSACDVGTLECYILKSLFLNPSSSILIKLLPLSQYPFCKYIRAGFEVWLSRKYNTIEEFIFELLVFYFWVGWSVACLLLWMNRIFVEP